MRTAGGSSETNLHLQACLQGRSSGVAEGDVDSKSSERKNAQSSSLSLPTTKGLKFISVLFIIYIC